LLLRGAEILIKCLEKEKVRVVFCYPGGANLDILEALKNSSIRMVLVRNEQGAAHAASGYARATGEVGVCLATSGPGATNLVTGIAAAYMDSIPVVAVTGQVATAMVGTDAFQEVDITGITDPISKHNYLVSDVNQLARKVTEAFHIAASGRPGPVLVDIPKDVAVAEATVEYVPYDRVELRGYKPNLTGHAGQIKQVAGLLEQARKPLICAGGGVLSAQAWDELRKLAEGQEIPVVHTLMGIGAFPMDHPLSFGMLGVYGAAPANLAVQNCDLLLALGMRFDDRVTGTVAHFARSAKIIHIDIDTAEIGKNVTPHIPLVGDLKIVLNQILGRLQSSRHTDWMTQVQGFRRSPEPVINENGLSPAHVLKALDALLTDDVIVTTDVGQHQMWAAKRLTYRKPRSFLTSGGLGVMGYGIPAAVGAQIACPDKTVVAVTGDGSFQMNMQELATAREQNLPIKVLLFNNSCLGMVKQLQDHFCRGSYAAVNFTGNPDFQLIGKAYGMETFRAVSREGLEETLAAFMSAPGMALLEAVTDWEENVYPMVLPGAGLETMTGLTEPAAGSAEPASGAE
jgi:acetolactate synthase-1/2/3 large subunit